jgi:hypothetical protein
LEDFFLLLVTSGILASLLFVYCLTLFIVKLGKQMSVDQYVRIKIIHNIYN